MENRVEYFEPCWAAQRSGLFFTCINSHFNADEVAYILDDCDAQVLVVCDTLRDVAAELVDKMPHVKVRLDGRRRARRVRAVRRRAGDAYPAVPLDEELEGTRMLYSSGTTGRPKGVKYKITRQRVGDQPRRDGDDDRGLGDGRGRHLPLARAAVPLGAAVLFDEHDAPRRHRDHHGALRSRARRSRCIEKYHVTHSQWVPTMFVRMLKLPDDVRNKYDTVVAEGRAARGRAVLGRDQTQDDRLVGPDHRRVLRRDRRHRRDVHQLGRLARAPGFGRPVDARPDPHPRRGRRRAARRARSAPCGSNRCRTGPGFEYHKDEAKTRDSFNDQGWSTVGDMGYLDDDGYLFLTDRRTFMIVSGGVNIYPQEAENLLIDHPKVYDVAVFGIPDPEMGERVHAVVQPVDWDDAGPELEQELLAYCREHLAHYKCPQAVDFDRELPREQTGKLYKRLAARPLLGRQDEPHRLMREPAALIASGRDGDIFEFAPGLVLRKTRDGRSIEHEARIMRYVAEHGYPGSAHRRSARRRHRDRDGAHRRPDDDGRDGAAAVEARRPPAHARRPARSAARDRRRPTGCRACPTTATGCCTSTCIR